MSRWRIYLCTTILKHIDFKNLMNLKKILILCIFVTGYSVIAQTPKRVQMHMQSKQLHKGQAITVVADVFFKYVEGLMVVHYSQPVNYVLITNSKGEIKAYYPDKNEVYTDQNALYSSQNDVLYSFLSNKASDMGLREMGFNMKSSRNENGLMINNWIPPAQNAGKISKIEIALENYLPIFTSYVDVKGKTQKKIYYSNYYKGYGISFPQRIVSVDYLPKGDSIVNRKLYSNVLFDRQAVSSYFDFSIPANAKPIKVARK